MAEIARDKAYRKLADRYCFEELGIAYNELEDEEKKAAIDSRVCEENGGLPGASMVSDAFFPFRDGVDAAAEGVANLLRGHRRHPLERSGKRHLYRFGAHGRQTDLSGLRQEHCDYPFAAYRIGDRL